MTKSLAYPLKRNLLRLYITLYLDMFPALSTCTPSACLSIPSAAPRGTPQHPVRSGLGEAPCRPQAPAAAAGGGRGRGFSVPDRFWWSVIDECCSGTFGAGCSLVEVQLLIKIMSLVRRRSSELFQFASRGADAWSSDAGSILSCRFIWAVDCIVCIVYRLWIVCTHELCKSDFI